MGHFISYIRGCTDKPKKQQPILFLTDKDVWDSERGTKLREYDRGKDFCGHASLLWYYDITTSNYKKCECRNLAKPSIFPKEIVNAVKNMEMVRISQGDSNWRGLLDLLNSKMKKKILKEFNIKVSEYENTEAMLIKANRKENLKFIKSLKIIEGTEEIGNDIKPRLIRIFKNCEARSGVNCGGSKYIIKYFCWSKTFEGQDYWANHSCTDVFEENDIPKSIDDLAYLDESVKNWKVMNERIWELFKDKKNRNPLWI